MFTGAKPKERYRFKGVQPDQLDRICSAFNQEVSNRFDTFDYITRPRAERSSGAGFWDNTVDIYEKDGYSEAENEFPFQAVERMMQSVAREVGVACEKFA